MPKRKAPAVKCMMGNKELLVYLEDKILQVGRAQVQWRREAYPTELALAQRIAELETDLILLRATRRTTTKGLRT